MNQKSTDGYFSALIQQHQICAQKRVLGRDSFWDISKNKQQRIQSAGQYTN